MCVFCVGGHRHVTASGHVHALGGRDCPSATSLVTPKSADSVFTFDLPPQTPPIKFESSSHGHSTAAGISCAKALLPHADQLCKTTSLSINLL